MPHDSYRLQVEVGGVAWGHRCFASASLQVSVLYYGASYLPRHANDMTCLGQLTAPRPPLPHAGAGAVEARGTAGLPYAPTGHRACTGAPSPKSSGQQTGVDLER